MDEREPGILLGNDSDSNLALFNNITRIRTSRRGIISLAPAAGVLMLGSVACARATSQVEPETRRRIEYYLPDYNERVVAGRNRENPVRVELSSLEYELFSAINGSRSDQSVNSLQLDQVLVILSRMRSSDMALRGYFSHQTPEFGNVFDLLESMSYPRGWAGESLARNNYKVDESVEVAFRDLMASEPHREIILSENYDRLGVGFARSSSGYNFFTMVFAQYAA